MIFYTKKEREIPPYKVIRKLDNFIRPQVQFSYKQSASGLQAKLRPVILENELPQGLCFLKS